MQACPLTLLVALLVAGPIDEERLYLAIATAESNNNLNAKNGTCVGPLQITKRCAKDAGVSHADCKTVEGSKKVLRHQIRGAKTWYHAVCIMRYGPYSTTAKETAKLSEADYQAHKHSRTFERFRTSPYWKRMEAIYGE